MSNFNDDKFGPRQLAWLRALENGTYKQTSGVLRAPGGLGKDVDEGFCCLGVACDLWDSGKWTPAETGDRFRYNNGHTTVLPDDVKDAYGFFNNNGGTDTASYEEDDEENGWLTNLNDNGHSFEQIAERVRRNPSAYFKEPK